MPPITDDDDVNLDDLDAVNGGPDEIEDELPEDDQDDENPDETDGDEEGSQDGDDDAALAAAERQRQARKPGRRDDRIEALTRQNKELAQRLDTVLASMGQQRQQPQQQGENEVQRKERRALMSETERLAEDVRDSELRTQRNLGGLQATIQDTTDRTLYQTKAAVDPLYKKWEARVEDELGKLRAQGSGAPREAIFYYLLGKAASESRGSKGNKKRIEDARRRIDRNTTRPGNSRSDAPGSNRRGGSGKSLEDRLSDVPL